MNYFEHKAATAAGTYHEWADSRNRDNRLAVEAWNASRARMLAAKEGYDLGSITLYMSKLDLMVRRNEAALFGLGVKRK